MRQIADQLAVGGLLDQQAFFVAIFSCCSIGRSRSAAAQPATLIGVSVQMTCSEIWLMVFSEGRAR